MVFCLTGEVIYFSLLLVFFFEVLILRAVMAYPVVRLYTLTHDFHFRNTILECVNLVSLGVNVCLLAISALHPDEYETPTVNTHT